MIVTLSTGFAQLALTMLYVYEPVGNIVHIIMLTGIPQRDTIRDMEIKQYYRIDKAGLKSGQFRLTIEHPAGGVIERKDGTPRELHVYRERHYPNAHNWRAHNSKYSFVHECPLCEA